MNKEPLFSVLIANYNNGKYLMDAIESVRKQSYTNWEIIIVDDASTDISKDIYKVLEKDEKILIHINSSNKGCGYTKRRCAELANGEICGFLDPDDALTDDAIEIMVYSHSQNKKAGLISSRLYYCDEKLKIISKSCKKQHIPVGSSFLEYQSNIITAFVSYKNECYKRTIGIDPFLLRAVDHDMYYKLEEVSEVLLLNDILYYYRTGTGNNISLGDNVLKAASWDFVSMINACNRRGILPEKIICEGLIYLIKEAKDVAKDQVRNTITYKIGKIVLFPLRKIKEFLG